MAATRSGCVPSDDVSVRASIPSSITAPIRSLDRWCNRRFDLLMPWSPREPLVVPSLSGPWGYIGWLGARMWRTVTLGMAMGTVWMVAQALVPWAIGRAVDAGIEQGSTRGLVTWCLVLLGLAVVTALATLVRHWLAVWNWCQGALVSSQVVGHHTSRTGTALPRTLPTGEVVSTVASDAIRLGDVYEVTARFVGSLVAYVVVVGLLWRSSTTLALVVGVGVPVLTALLGLVIKPLQSAQSFQREVSGELTTLAADTVAGLRVLRGLGGEKVFLDRYVVQSDAVRRAGVRVAGVQAVLDSAQVLLPGAFVVLVTWLGARFAVAGQITPGELVAFYGYAAFLVAPLRTATEMLQKLSRGHVAARKILGVLAVATSVPEPADPATEPGPLPDLVDPVSGVRIRPGRLTAVVSASPTASAGVAERLARLTASADGDTSARLGGVAVDTLPRAVLRRRVVLADADPQLFTGWVRTQLDPHGRHDDATIRRAVAAAAAEDVLDGLPAGLDDEVSERGRSLSGGQRQRFALARALLTEAETLLLVEPTSAVDAHTEATVALRLGGVRRGRTTVVVTASPLLLDRVDHVVVLGPDGTVAGEGTHHELLGRDDDLGRSYRDTVTRGEEQQ